MRIAVISDIHSNIYALDKVIEDIKSKNVDMIILYRRFSWVWNAVQMSYT